MLVKPDVLLNPTHRSIQTFVLCQYQLLMEAKRKMELTTRINYRRDHVSAPFRILCKFAKYRGSFHYLVTADYLYIKAGRNVKQNEKIKLGQSLSSQTKAAQHYFRPNHPPEAPRTCPTTYPFAASCYATNSKILSKIVCTSFYIFFYAHCGIIGCHRNKK